MKIIFKILLGLSELIGKIFTQPTYIIFTSIKARFYTAFHKSNFAFLGDRSIIYGHLWLYNGKQIKINDYTTINSHCILTAWNSQNFPKTEENKIIIGKRCNIGEYNHITAVNKIVIGDDVLTGRWVTITDNSHGDTDSEILSIPPLKRPIVSKGPTIIGNSVWLGDKVTILPGVTLGDECVVAANSVVTKSFPEKSVIGGIPAKLLKS